MSAKLRIERLDSVRFLAALWVAISHDAVPLKSLTNEPAARMMLSILTSSFNGVAAVMVFFIVSGLCIHLPYTGGRTVPVLPFLVRRYLRVGLPLLAILAIAHTVGQRSEINLAGVTWSVYAELFYYSLYPMMFWLAKRFGWIPLIGSALLLAAAVVIKNWGAPLISNLGWMAWVWGLPIWLSGCLLADYLRTRPAPILPGEIWVWRAAAWGFSVLCLYLAVHSPIRIGHPISMLMFSLLAWGWLLKELQCRRPAWSVFARLSAPIFVPRGEGRCEFPGELVRWSFDQPIHCISGNHNRQTLNKDVCNRRHRRHMLTQSGAVPLGPALGWAMFPVGLSRPRPSSPLPFRFEETHSARKPPTQLGWNL
jgi:peptidoglycan/LPS O-acetylase OafA/YrhL